MPKRKRRKKGHYNRGVFVSVKTGQACKYRSGWELLLLQFLEIDVNVACYGYECVKIPYLSNSRSGKMRNYIPDMFVETVSGERFVIEIKPKRKLEQSTVVKKLKAASEWSRALGVTLIVITEVQLKLLGLMK